MRRHLVNSTISLLSVLVATGCAEKVDTSKNLQEAPSAIARILGPALLDDCPQGGVEMEYGIDSNASGVLDDEEVNGSYSICHGEAGLEGAPGEACYAVEQEGEVYVLQCPGQEAVPLPAGPPGQAGVTGETGMPGEQGMDGANGLQVLVVTADEPWGETCPSGGVRIHSGLDTNGNGVLDADEVAENNAVCHGAQGEKGDQGDQGDKGEPGETGKQGPPGMDGLNGKDGETGKQGPLGMDGKVGEDGAPGKQGPPGLDGFNGADGDREPMVSMARMGPRESKVLPVSRARTVNRESMVSMARMGPRATRACPAQTVYRAMTARMAFRVLPVLSERRDPRAKTDSPEPMARMAPRATRDQPDHPDPRVPAPVRASSIYTDVAGMNMP